MYAQFFGSYLLNKEAVTAPELIDAISRFSKSHIKLGPLAIHHGYMTAQEVDEVCYVQTREDKRFGEIAVERGYLTRAQVEALLQEQTPDYLLLGQILVEQKVLTHSDLESLILDYQAQNELLDLNESTLDEDRVLSLVKNFFVDIEKPITDYSLMYMSLLFNSLTRFIGEDFTPLPPIACQEYPVTYCVKQKISGMFDYLSSIDMPQDVAIAFASRYAKDNFQEFDEYVQASIEDFLNLHNGLFLVNMSNDYSIELELSPPEVETQDVVTLAKDTFVIPIVYPFGTFHLIITL